VSVSQEEIDWNGESTTITDEHANEHEIVYLCENCGAARGGHKSQPAGHNQKAVCKECGSQDLRKKSVEEVKE